MLEPLETCPGAAWEGAEQVEPEKGQEEVAVAVAVVRLPVGWAPALGRRSGRAP